LQYVDHTTECFDGVMVQIREFPINARQWSVADQTSEQAQSGVPLGGFRDQTFVRDHSSGLCRGWAGGAVSELDWPSRQRGNQEQNQTIAAAIGKPTAKAPTIVDANAASKFTLGCILSSFSVVSSFSDMAPTPSLGR
jgi:hypothetical protein